MSLDSSGVGSYDVSWPARTEEPNGVTSPEELIAAAHSTCYSMSLSNVLTKAGHAVETIDTKADVTFQPGEGITGSALTTRASVPGLSAKGSPASPRRPRPRARSAPHSPAPRSPWTPPSPDRWPRWLRLAGRRGEPETSAGAPGCPRG